MKKMEENCATLCVCKSQRGWHITVVNFGAPKLEFVTFQLTITQLSLFDNMYYPQVYVTRAAMLFYKLVAKWQNKVEKSLFTFTLQFVHNENLILIFLNLFES